MKITWGNVCKKACHNTNITKCFLKAPEKSSYTRRGITQGYSRFSYASNLEFILTSSSPQENTQFRSWTLIHFNDSFLFIQVIRHLPCA